MYEKVLVMGLPGVGKSTANSCILKIAQNLSALVECHNDYDILRTWYEAEPNGTIFSQIHDGGFDIHNYTIFDAALQVLEKQIFEKTKLTEDGIMTIEFARSNYVHALSQFSAAFLQNAYFLFIDAEIEVCKARVEQRVRNRRSSDDHPVSDYIFEAYYANGREYCTAADINALRDRDGVQYALDPRRMKIVKNTDGTTLQNFYAEIQQLTLKILKSEPISESESLAIRVQEEVSALK